jgi:hypothetical protein
MRRLGVAMPSGAAFGIAPCGPWELGGWWRSARPRSTRPSSTCRTHDACRRQCDIGPASEPTHGSRAWSRRLVLPGRAGSGARSGTRFRVRPPSAEHRIWSAQPGGRATPERSFWSGSGGRGRAFWLVVRCVPGHHGLPEARPRPERGHTPRYRWTGGAVRGSVAHRWSSPATVGPIDPGIVRDDPPRGHVEVTPLGAALLAAGPPTSRAVLRR